MKCYQNPLGRPSGRPAATSRHVVAAIALGCAAWACFPVSSHAAAKDHAQAAPAKAAVATFLDAVARGDDATARGMLTKVARAKTEEMGISVAPPVADTATYAVKDCEIVSEAGDMAHVATTWTDVDPDGEKTSENVVWVVRLEPEGWRVVGMAMRVFDDMPPLLLNFEDPDDMVAKQEMVAAELERRAREPAEAAAPGSRTARGSGQPAGTLQ